MSIFPKVTQHRLIKVGQKLVVDISGVDELKKFYYPGVTDTEFTVIDLPIIDGQRFMVIHDGERVFSLEVEVPTTNQKAKGWLDEKY